MKINEILAEKKYQAREAIKEIVTKFTEETGMIVDNVSVERESRNVVNPQYLVHFDIKLS